MILDDIANCGVVLNFICVNIAWRSGATQPSRGKNQILSKWNEFPWLNILVNGAEGIYAFFSRC